MQQPHQRPRQPHIEYRRLGSPGESGSVIKDDEIDIARIVELARSHLAHREHDVARARPRRRGIDVERPPPLRAHQQVIHRGADRGIGERSLQFDHPRYRPNAADIGESKQQRRLRLHAPKDAHYLGFVGHRGNPALCLRENVR